MEKHRTKTQLILAWITVISVLISIIAISFAWFSFNSAPYVEPMDMAKVSEGEAGILISEAQAGPFDVKCPLRFANAPKTLSPVSTENLTDFFQATVQNRKGITLAYKNVTKDKNQYVINGTVYIQNQGGKNKIYFLPSATALGTNAQVTSALRLGMEITTGSTTQKYLFRLDSLASGKAESTLTVPTKDTVVSSISAAGTATYKKDPSVNIADYMAVENGDKPQAGRQFLCEMQDKEIASVQYWIYMEGCDENCLGSVQSKDLTVSFGFGGVSEGGTT